MRFIRHRKFFIILSVSFLCFLSFFPFFVSPVFAYNGGLLEGKTPTSVGVTPATGDLSTITDNNTSTGVSYTGGNVYRFDLGSDYTISSYRLILSNTNGLSDNIKFYKSDGSLIGSVNGVNKSAQTNVNFTNVRYVEYGYYSTAWTGSETLEEFDVYGSPAAVHNDVSGLTESHSDSSVMLSWDSLSSLSDFDHFNVYRDSVLISSPVSNSYQDSAVTASTSYVYRVTGVYSDGFETSGSIISLVTDQTPADPAPGQVTSLTTSVVSDTSVHLSWSAPSDSDLAGFYVYKNDTLLDTLTTAETSFDVTGLSPSTTYTLKVSAFDSAGHESLKDSVDITTLAEADLTPPNVVDGVKLTPGDASAFAEWKASAAADLQGYNLYVDGAKINTDLIHNSFATIPDLTNGQTYSVQVSAVDSNGNESALSVPVDVSPSLGLMPVIHTSYTLSDVAQGVGNWFKSYWLIIAFATSIPLSFYIASRVKLLFLD